MSAVRRYLGDQLLPSEPKSRPAAKLWSVPGTASPATCCFLLKDLLDPPTETRYCAKYWEIHKKNTVYWLTEKLRYLMRTRLYEYKHYVTPLLLSGFRPHLSGANRKSLCYSDILYRTKRRVHVHSQPYTIIR
jgi:hypothetical protein